MLRSSFSAALALWTASTLGAQIVQNTVTVTASANPNLQPDQVNFSLDVTSAIQTGINDVLTALQGVGVTMANFTGIGAGQTFVFQPARKAQPSIDWYFNLPVSIPQTKQTIAALTALQGTLTRNNPGLVLSFSVQGTTVSQQLHQSQTCSLPGLIASARVQAKALTDAAGLMLGNILAISRASTQSTTVGSADVTDSSPCSITVKFAVLRNQ